MYRVYNTLVAINEDFELQPELATSWYSPDSTTIVLALREGGKFHDGSSFDAEAVKFNFERMKQHPLQGPSGRQKGASSYLLYLGLGGRERVR